MEIPVLVVPHPPGFRASTGGPLDLTADGPTADAALAALKEQIAARLRAGAQLRTLNIPVAPAGGGLAAHPLFDDWLRAVEDYRQQRDEEERAAEAVAGG